MSHTGWVNLKEIHLIYSCNYDAINESSENAKLFTKQDAVKGKMN